MKNWALLERRPIVAGAGRIVCVANQKGGVAKTTTSVNLGAGLALRGHRVLLVDLDPQSNATTGVGVERGNRPTTYEVLTGEADVSQAAAPTKIRGLDCIAASIDLAGAEIELAGTMERENKLSLALAPAAASYDIVFVDCPPSLGLLTLNALVAAQDLFVPVQCEYYALEGLGQLLTTAERVRKALNPQLRIAGFLLTMYDARTKLSSQVADEVRKHFGRLVFETVIPRSVRLSEAPSFGEPVLTLDPSSRGSVSYRLLAAEVEELYGLEVHVPPRPSPRTDEMSKGPDDVVVLDAQGHQEVLEVRKAAAGPGGRGFGAVTPEPPDLERAWPKSEPWTVTR
jgi:chromosome partitioning protein